MILNKVVTHKYKAFSSNVLKNLCISKNMKRLPILKKQFTVLRSPHIDKKSREQFELRTHAWTNTHVVTHEDKQIESLVGIGHQKKNCYHNTTWIM